jgi:MFS transporter, FSR family, fosmidomycin resistance protein
MSHDHSHRSRTLALATVLHAFTHIYQMALIPLYLPMQKFFRRDSVDDATLLVTVLLVAYFLPSYVMGVLADRFSKKKLLTVGLIINALGFIGLAFAPSYPVALGCVILAGLGGSFFHPSATALVAQLYPGTTGRALGTLGIGASVGFCVGPLYAGWRAQMAGDWRWPVAELGAAGLVMAARCEAMRSQRERNHHANPCSPRPRCG